MRELYKPPTLVTVEIYALIEPGTEHSRDPHVRYIGQTDQGLQARLSQHIADARANRMGNEALRDWILRLLRRRQRPVIQLQETCTSHVSADLAEIHHIEVWGQAYPDLLNLRDNPHRSQPRHFPERFIKEVS